MFWYLAGQTGGLSTNHHNTYQRQVSWPLSGQCLLIQLHHFDKLIKVKSILSGLLGSAHWCWENLISKLEVAHIYSPAERNRKMRKSLTDMNNPLASTFRDWFQPHLWKKLPLVANYQHLIKAFRNREDRERWLGKLCCIHIDGTLCNCR